MNKHKVKDAMTPQPVVVSLEDRVVDIMDVMKKGGFDHLPVVNAQNELKGIISKNDLYRKLVHLLSNTAGKTYLEKVLSSTRAEDIMTPDPVQVSPENNVIFASEILLQGMFHALPVVEEGKISGIVTAKDILQFITDHIKAVE